MKQAIDAYLNRVCLSTRVKGNRVLKGRKRGRVSGRRGDIHRPAVHAETARARPAVENRPYGGPAPEMPPVVMKLRAGRRQGA